MWAVDEKLITDKCLYSCFSSHGKNISPDPTRSIPFRQTTIQATPLYTIMAAV